ncbi:MAG TPA: hypothetical protein VF598_14230 [Hymenobacter sp.]
MRRATVALKVQMTARASWDSRESQEKDSGLAVVWFPARSDLRRMNLALKVGACSARF